MRAHSGASASIPTCDAPKTVADILTAAADLIEPEGAWTQGEYGRLPSGRAALNVRDDAVCRCLIGAIFTVLPPESGCLHEVEKGPAVQTMNEFLGIGAYHWNDAPERTQAEVVAALRAAAEKARTAPSDTQPGTQPGLPGEVKQSPANQEQDQ